MLINPMKIDEKKEGTYDKVFELQDITRIIQNAHNNIKECRKAMLKNNSREVEMPYVKKAQLFYSRLHKKNIEVYSSGNNLSKNQNLIVWANDLLASRGYRIFDAVTKNWKNAKMSHAT